MKYNVHLYTVVRVKVVGVEAESQEKSVHEAIRLMGRDLDGFLKSPGHPCFAPTPLPSNVEYFEYEDDILGALVDEEGDEEFERTEYHPLLTHEEIVSQYAGGSRGEIC